MSTEGARQYLLLNLSGKRTEMVDVNLVGLRQSVCIFFGAAESSAVSFFYFQEEKNYDSSN